MIMFSIKWRNRCVFRTGVFQRPPAEIPQREFIIILAAATGIATGAAAASAAVAAAAC